MGWFGWFGIRFYKGSTRGFTRVAGSLGQGFTRILFGFYQVLRAARVGGVRGGLRLGSTGILAGFY